MQHTCKSCSKLLNEGDIVKVEIISKYHILKSTVAYALDKDLTALSETLHHVNCQYPRGGTVDEN